MALSDRTLVFHESFPPEMSYISKILRIASEEFKGTKEDISLATGMPTGKSSGKVVPHIKYAKYMNLINFNVDNRIFNLELTKLGELIYREDPYLLEDLTKMLCQYYLTDKVKGAPQWSFLFRVFNYEYENPITIKYIEEKASAFFEKEVDLGPVKSTYIREDSLGSLNLIRVDESAKNKIVFNNSHIKNEALYLYAYTLLESWETIFGDTREITIDQITNEIGWNKAFGFDEFKMLEVFEGLRDLNLIHINKQLNPITVVKLCCAEEVLWRIYTLLI